MNIKISEITKKYENITVLNHVSLEFLEGTITGLIGRNGSGKTMILKALCGFIKLDEGVISVDGETFDDITKTGIPVGAIIETPGFLSQYSGFKNLEFLSLIQKRIDKKKIKETMELVGLNPDEKKPVGKYSLGMRQRLGIAQALMEEPDILLLDEPMNGLDNIGVKQMQQLFLELKKKGKTIVLASHNREDIQLLCDYVVELDQGKVIQRYEAGNINGLEISFIK
ncbi:ATP-binding cassette domain-containing protein [Konateibacter massiliensis]|uniref:ATP-binding cassette domain-containing protein n=1 Tax=Konateibacter massiliensis TaxID=2002841 RepID=UPI002E2566DE|nr:ATP-binding cassette domain-containing protein [Konateibacter massiliensis]